MQAPPRPPPLPKSDAVVVGVGARTHTGMTALQAVMAIRANKMVPRESHIVDAGGNPVGTCRLPSIADNVQGFDRFVALAVPALVQATHSWLAFERRRAQQPKPLPAIIALPSGFRPGFDPKLRKDFLSVVAEASGVALDPKRSTLVTKCRGGGVEAFDLGLAKLRSGAEEAVVVGGVDSWFDPDVLEYLEAERRLHGPDCENGFLPGEGAAFVVLTTRSRASALHRWGQVISATTEVEPRPYGSEEPCHALGMTMAIRRAVEATGLKSRRIPWQLTDVHNERHRVDEWQMARLRMFEAFADDVVHDQPLLRAGDLGAASAAFLAVVACVNWYAHCAPGDCVLVATHSDGAERGAMVLAQEPPA
jgi:3-oxoacyl-[acyl-carrier-protein] synthase I